MKSNTQQVVSVFLVVCLFIGLLLGAITDGFSDFSMFEYKPQADAEESKNVVANCSSAVALSSDISTVSAEPITWQNERVELEVELVSGDINADTGFSISEDGIFSLTNVDYYQTLMESNRYAKIYINIVAKNGTTVSGRFDFADIPDLSHFDLMRELCKTFLLVDNYRIIAGKDTYSTISIYADSKSGGFYILSDLEYKLNFHFLDRVSDLDSRVKAPSIEDGYIFDGWYNDEALTSYYGKEFPAVSVEDRHFYYIDEIKYPKVSPAVTLTFVSYTKIDTLKCAVGTTFSDIQTISLLNIQQLLNSYADNVYFTNEDGVELSKNQTMDIVFDKDMTFTSNCMFSSYTLEFSNEGEVFYEYCIEIDTVLDTSLIPVAERKGYDVDFYYTDREGVEKKYNGEKISYPYEFKIEYVLHPYIAKLYRKEYAVGDPNMSWSYNLIDTVEFTYNEHDFSSYLRENTASRTYYWRYENGIAFNTEDFVYEDIALYEDYNWNNYTLTVYYGSSSDVYKKENFFEFKIAYGTEVYLYSLDMPLEKKLGYVLKFGGISVVDNRFVAHSSEKYLYITVEQDCYSYCAYVPIVYNVTFNREYDGYVKTSTFTCESGIELLSVPRREGYDFVGWFFEDGTAYDNSKTYYEDLVLYDKWQIQRKTITLMSDGVMQWSFNVDYGTSLEDVLSVINEKNYNVVSFTSANFREDQSFVGDTTFEVQVMDEVDSIKNTIKNKWQIIVVVAVGAFLVIGIVSVIPKFKRRKR